MKTNEASSTSYNEYYQQQLQAGQEFQDHVAYVLYQNGLPFVQFNSRRYQFKYGEGPSRIEVKLDRRWRETGRFYIEVAEKSHPSRPNYTPSGILRDDNTSFWAIGDYSTFWLLPRQALIARYRSDNFKIVETPTSRGMLLPQAQVQLAGLEFNTSDEEAS